MTNNLIDIEFYVGRRLRLGSVERNYWDSLAGIYRRMMEIKFCGVLLIALGVFALISYSFTGHAQMVLYGTMGVTAGTITLLLYEGE